MIALLTGLLAFKAPALVTVDVHGVGYEVLIPLSTYYALPNPSESVTLRIHTHVREDAGAMTLMLADDKIVLE